MMELTKQKSYLIGLLCGRGHIYRNDKKLIIEFAHKHLTAAGIAYCEVCAGFATEKKENNPNKDLFCKSCGGVVPKSVRKVYKQKSSTIESINNVIIPFLKIGYDSCIYTLVGNDHMTYLIIDFADNNYEFQSICEILENRTGFDSFEIPLPIWKTSKDNQIEFINGMLDTAGFFNSGGWLNIPGNSTTGRMRCYFQIVRNWKMPVQICNFLRSVFKLPIHSIDWGHPNTRDSNMKDYYDSNPLSWSREHQVKFFPEYYNLFTIRLEHKQQMFDELKSHNLHVGFEADDDCNPPKKISINKVKPIHPGERDKRLPLMIRRHHNSYCQICSNLGCIFMADALNNAKNPDSVYSTGEDKPIDANFIYIQRQYLERSRTLADAIHSKKQAKLKAKIEKLASRNRTNPEQQLYAPLVEFYAKHLAEKYGIEAKVHDTSAYFLDRFIIQNDLIEEFDFCNEYKIKPDIVGFLPKIKELAFMEVKANELTLQDLGQLLGYCLVAQPIEAILVSPKPPSLSLVLILKTNPNLLVYGLGKRIEIATWKNGDLEFLNY